MFIDSAQTRLGDPSGPGATSREGIFLVATESSSSVTASFSRHSTDRVKDDRDYLATWSCRRNKVPITSASNSGSMFAVSGGPRGLFIKI
jgi:hypothetical protein